MCPPRRKISNIEVTEDKKSGALRITALLDDGDLVSLQVPGFLRGSGASDLVSKKGIINAFERLSERQKPDTKGIYNGLADVRRKV